MLNTIVKSRFKFHLYAFSPLLASICFQYKSPFHLIFDEGNSNAIVELHTVLILWASVIDTPVLSGVH